MTRVIRSYEHESHMPRAGRNVRPRLPRAVPNVSRGPDARLRSPETAGTASSAPALVARRPVFRARATMPMGIGVQSEAPRDTHGYHVLARELNRRAMRRLRTPVTAGKPPAGPRFKLALQA